MTLHILSGDYSEEPVSAPSLRAVWRQLCARLSVGGARTLTAAERWNCGQPSGRQVTASLYDGYDQIVDSRGRRIWGS
ncbi:MAG: hypothetical protein HY323_03455 [Betaproteobacteria bacterium]|nr:hypothetical protein [Betaproteobacteria bacterium]